MRYTKTTGTWAERSLVVEGVRLCDGCGEKLVDVAYEDQDTMVRSLKSGEVDVCEGCFATKVVPALRAVGLVMHDDIPIDLTVPEKYRDFLVVETKSELAESEQRAVSIIDELVAKYGALAHEGHHDRHR